MKRKITDLREKRASVFEQMRALNDKALDEERDLYPDEHDRYSALESKFDSLCEEIEVAERRAGLGVSPRPSSTDPSAFDRTVVARSGGFPIHLGAPSERHENVRNAVTLGREQRVRDWAENRSGAGFTPADNDEFCLGNVMRAMAQPAFRSELTDVESRALSVGVDAGGGFLTPEILSLDFIDKVRNAGRVFQAGAQTVPLDSDKQSIPRLSTDPSGAWRAENAPFTESEHAFERVTFSPKAYGFIVKTSEELYQDMLPAGGQAIENAIVQTAALELDRVALRGSGTGQEPQGIRNQTGVTIQSLGANGATPSGYSDPMTAITTLLGDNVQPTGWMMAPRTSQTYAGKLDTTNQPLNPPQPVADLSTFVTNQIPTDITQGTSTDTSEIYVGDWRDLLVGIRLGVTLRLLTERYADNGQFAWRVFLRADVQLAHPESFVVITGVRP